MFGVSNEIEGHTAMGFIEKPTVPTGCLRQLFNFDLNG